MVSDADAGSARSLVLTGERTLPGIDDENYWFRRHEAAYRATAPFVTGAKVLDAGCGEGYGAALLKGYASRVVGLDYDALTAAHARSRYPGVGVVQGDLQHLPIADSSLDVLVCLQVIEHLWDQPGFVSECARVLRPAGTLVVSTPNRLTFSPSGAVLNPFHTRELSGDELAELLSPSFVVTRLYGLQHAKRLRRFERRHGSLVDAQVAGPPQTWSASVRRRVHRVDVSDFVITEGAIQTSLDLIAVGRKRTAADR